MREILYSILIFTGTLTAIGAAILWVVARLVPKGEVHIRVNRITSYNVCYTKLLRMARR